jgi:hypothetical protein
MSMTIWLEPHRYCQFDVMACVPNYDDPICDYVILLHCLALVIANLGGLIMGGWHTWIMEMEIIMMNSSMEISKGTMGYTKSISVLMPFLLCSTFTCDNVFVYMRL